MAALVDVVPIVCGVSNDDQGSRDGVGGASHGGWPLLDLRVTSGDLSLTPVNEADAFALADLLPDDLELDPAATTYAMADPRDARRAVALQSHWRAHGSWRPEAWRIDFAVRRAGRLVGLQELEATDFPRLKTVDSASWLIHDVRGHGVGKAMRRAALALAFGPLGAEAAITSAWPDNAASLGVSQSLGYRPNGVHRHARDGGVDTMLHLVLTRADWLAGVGADVSDVQIDGFEACRPLFDL